jgi:hypothetical protein
VEKGISVFQISLQDLRFTVVVMKSFIFWYITSYNSLESQLKIQRNVLPPYSELKNKSSKNPVCEADNKTTCFTPVSCLAYYNIFYVRSELL